MSSHRRDSTDERPDVSESVQYSGGGGAGVGKRNKKAFFFVCLASAVVVAILFLLAFRSNVGTPLMGPGGATEQHSVICVNPCLQPGFACHPSSDRDDRGCFEAGCACFPEYCPKRCPHHQECVLESEIDARGCFKPNCKCGKQELMCTSISADPSLKNCSNSCAPGEKCHSNAAVDTHGCPLRGCVCVPDCLSPCAPGKRCQRESPLDAKGCFKPGCKCEPDCPPRCPEGSDCDPHSPRDLHGCYLAHCTCEQLKTSRQYTATKEPSCLSPCPLGKRCVENATKDEHGCFLRGCICELDCPPRCPAGQRCKQGSPKDFEGCFLFGCTCESTAKVSWRSRETWFSKAATSTTSNGTVRPSEERKARTDADPGSFPLSFADSHILVPDDSGVRKFGNASNVVQDTHSLYLHRVQDKWRRIASIGAIKWPSENASSEIDQHDAVTQQPRKPSESGERNHPRNELQETGNHGNTALADAQDDANREDTIKKSRIATSYQTLPKEPKQGVETTSRLLLRANLNGGTPSTGAPTAQNDDADDDDEYGILSDLLPEEDPIRKRVVNFTRTAEPLYGSHHLQSSALRTVNSDASPSVHQRKPISQTHR